LLFRHELLETVARCRCHSLLREGPLKVQINSDKTIVVSAGLKRFLEGEVSRVLERFSTRLTRVEIHLSDVDNQKAGQADKRCLVEARPAGAKPLSASAKARDVASAVSEASGKMQRLLIRFFGRIGKSAAAATGPVSPRKTAGRKSAGRKPLSKETALGTGKAAAVKKAGARHAKKLSPRGPKKKRIYQARRKAWPGR